MLTQMEMYILQLEDAVLELERNLADKTRELREAEQELVRREGGRDVHSLVTALPQSLPLWMIHLFGNIHTCSHLMQASLEGDLAEAQSRGDGAAARLLRGVNEAHLKLADKVWSASVSP